MRYLLNAEQMKRADRYTTQGHGIPSMVLMERAALSCVRFMEEHRLDMSDACIICGSGNNGGDGFAIGRILRLKGFDVRVVFAGEESHCTNETAEQMKQLKKTGAGISNCFEPGEYSILVDAIFGAGLSRNIEGKYARLVENMNASQGYKLSVDIPSGISADNGLVMGTAFKADATVTFQVEKLGLIFYPGREYAGEVSVADIGIDAGIMEHETAAAATPGYGEYRTLLPMRRPDSNKGTYGRLLVVAGSKGMAGAAYFNAKAAYMSGAGLVMIYTAEENRTILQGMLPEAVMKTYTSFDGEELAGLLKWADAVCAGSGLGTGDVSRQIINAIMEQVEVPCVIDGDGLNLIAGQREEKSRLNERPFIFTPHMKEMARLTDKTVDELRKCRMEILEAFVRKTGITCVLKDSRTVTASPGEHPCVNLSGNAAMAKAGSGDVLAGVISGLLAQGLADREAAILGTYLHGRSGDLARRDMGSYSVLAGDIIDYLGAAMKEQEDEEIEGV